MSGTTPRRTSSGSTSAAFPTRPTDRLLSRLLLRRTDPLERLVQRAGLAIAVPGGHTFIYARLVHLDAEQDGAVHRRGQGLGAAHAAQAGGDHQPSAQRTAKVLSCDRAKRLVCALDNSLRADVDPRAGGHLPVHHQPSAFERAEVLPGALQRPTRLLFAISTRGADSCACETRPRGFPLCIKQGLVVLQEGAQRCDDRVQECLPAPCRPPRSAVDHQVIGAFGDLWIQVVHEHAQRRTSCCHPRRSSARSRAARAPVVGQSPRAALSNHRHGVAVDEDIWRSLYPWRHRSSEGLSGAHRGTIVIELQIWLRLEGDREIEGEVPVGRLREAKDGAPIMQIALETQDVVARENWRHARGRSSCRQATAHFGVRLNPRSAPMLVVGENEIRGTANRSST